MNATIGVWPVGGRHIALPMSKAGEIEGDAKAPTGWNEWRV